MKARRAVVFAAFCCAVAIPGRGAGAQESEQPVQPEIRVDAIAARSTAFEAGAGLSVPMGLYVRTGVVVGAGGGSGGFDARADLVSRFNLDPFRQSRWAPYAGGGLSLRYSERDAPRTHGFLLVLVGLEGPILGGRAAGWEPAFELGLGGGARFGVILRRGIAGRR